MADRLVAFLRAINVGGHVVKMAALKKAFEQLGFGDVETFIASGNVIFTSPTRDSATLEKRIEAGLEKSLGYEVATFVRTTTEVGRLAKAQPFKDAERDGVTLFIGFLGHAPSAEACKRVERLRSDGDDLRVDGKELFWLRRGSLLDSKVSGALLEKTLGSPMTLRNVKTVRRIAEKYSAKK